MKTILLLTFVVFSNGGKLDKTYLPPATAQSAGGYSLETPKSAPGLVDGISGQYNYAGNRGENIAGILGQYNNGRLNGQYNNAGILSQYNIGRLNGQYSNAGILGQYNTGSFQQPISNFNNYNSFAANFRPERPQAFFERNAAILRYDNINNVDNYAYRYETSNGITADETGIATNGVVAQGGFSYLGDDGRQYTVRYTADENGFRPIGDHLPTPPPIPEAILRSLEQNARDEAAGIFDDGSYNENLYGDKRGYNHGYNYPAANLANLQAIKNIEQANIQAQAINLLEQAKQVQAINHAVQANNQAQAISQLEQAKQAQAINHAAQANIQAQDIDHGYNYPSANLANLQAIKNVEQANIQAQAISQLEQAKQAQGINHAAQANIQAQDINHGYNYPAANLANLQAIKNVEQANIQAQAISQLEQAKQDQGISHAAQANIQGQDINYAAQANIQAQAINHLEQAKSAQAINNLGQANVQAVDSLVQAKSTAGSRAYLPPKGH